MTGLETITDALDKVGISYTVRDDGDFQYLFFGEREGMYLLLPEYPERQSYKTFHDGPLDLALLNHSFIEFENGEFAGHLFR